jgi:hypothetical protein
MSFYKVTHQVKQPIDVENEIDSEQKIDLNIKARAGKNQKP